MSTFVLKKLKKIDLGEGAWVKVPLSLSFGDVKIFRSEGSEYEKSLAFLLRYIREWNFTDEDGVILDILEENIVDIPTDMAAQIQQQLIKDLPKESKKKLEKELANSQKQSKEMLQTKGGSTT